MYASGQQRSMALHPSHQTTKRTVNNSQYNNGPALYGPNSRRNVNFQQVVETSPNHNNRNNANLNESILSDQSPRTPFYPSFGSSFGNTTPSSNVFPNSSLTTSGVSYNSNNVQPSQPQQQQPQQQQQHLTHQSGSSQKQHHTQHHAQSGMATGPVFGSRIMNDGSSTQFAIQNSGESSRVQHNTPFISENGSAYNDVGERQITDSGANHHQQQQITSAQLSRDTPSQHSDKGTAANAEQLLSLQQLNRHMAQLAGNVATSISQNELVISLLERLVSLTENMTSNSNNQRQTASTYSNSVVESSDQIRNEQTTAITPNSIARSHDSPHSTTFGQRIPPFSTANASVKQISIRQDNTIENANSTGHSSDLTSYPQSEIYPRETQASSQTSPQFDQNVQESETRQDNNNASTTVSSLSDAFDDPLNFIGTPASTTHHQTNGIVQMPISSSSTSNSLQPPIQSHHRLSKTAGSTPSRGTYINEYHSSLTPHSGPPRLGDEEHDDHQNNHIPSPVFSDSMPVPTADEDDEFSSFDLIMTMPTRRESRRISLRAQQQRKSLSQQFQAQQQQKEQQESRDKETQIDDSNVEQNDESIDVGQTTTESIQVNDSSPIRRQRATRGRKRKAVLPRESLLSSSTFDTADTSRVSDNSRIIDTNEDQDADQDDSWLEWLEPRRPPPSVTRDLPTPKYRTIKEVRLERKAKTNRSLATIGRIPLKEYLEVGGDPEYRSVRRLARTVYNNWLEPNVRLAKQDSERLLACFHKIEYDFPILADCENHWKVRELMLQVIDNAIDEVAFHKRKEARLQNKAIANSSHNSATKKNGKVNTEKRNFIQNGRRNSSRTRAEQNQEEDDNEDEEDESEVEESTNNVSLQLDKDANLSQVWDNEPERYKGNNTGRMSTRSSSTYHHDNRQNDSEEWDAAHDPALLDAPIPGIHASEGNDDHMENYVPGRASLNRRGAHTGMSTW